MARDYKLFIKAYDLVDVVYFTDKGRNPRQAIVDLILQGASKVFEMGSGTMSNAIRIAQARPQAEVVGMDSSEVMVAGSREKLSGLDLPNVTLLEGDATRTDFEDGAFDHVIISLILHEASDELARGLLAEARRLLKPAGRLIVLEWEAPTGFGKQLLFAFIRLLEDKHTFPAFLQMDKGTYFQRYGFEIEQEAQCDYSVVFSLKRSQTGPAGAIF